MKNPFSSTKFRQLIVASLLLIAGYVNGQWKVETSGGSSGYRNAVRYNSTGDVYVVLQDASNGNKATVQKKNGATWSIVGTAGFSTYMVYEPSIAVNQANGDVYVTYIESVSGIYKLSCNKFNGTSWVDVGTPEFVITGATGKPGITINNNGNPVIVTPFYNGFYVYQFDGTSWINLTANPPSATPATTPLDILYQQGTRGAEQKNNYFPLVGSDGSIYLAVSSPYIGDDGVMVMKYAGGTWTKVGANLPGGSWTSLQRVTFAPNGELHVSYAELRTGSSNYCKIHVRKWNGSSWVDLTSSGTKIFNSTYTNFNSFSFDIAFDSNSIPYVVYQNTGGDWRAHLKKYNSATSNWDLTQTTNYQGFNIDAGIRLFIDSNNSPFYVATSGSEPRVYVADKSSVFRNYAPVSPTTGGEGTTVQLFGVNLLNATNVSFNGVSASFTTDATYSPTLDIINTTVPSGATTGTISVTNSFGTTTTSSFIVTTPAPTITSFTPTSGPIGSIVTLTGTNFTGTTAVTINGTAATSFTVNSATSITATIPTGATTGAIAVTTAGGTATSSSNYTVAGQIIAEYQFNNSLAASIGAFGNAAFGLTAATLNATNICTDALSSSTNSLIIPSITSLDSTSFQVDVDLKVTLMPTSTSYAFMLSGGSRAFGLGVNPNGTLFVSYNLSTGTSVTTQTSPISQPITLNTNHSISVQLVNNSIRVKLDGTLVIVHGMQTGLSTLTTNSRDFYLGDHPAGSLPLQACYDNFRIINNPAQFSTLTSITTTPNLITGLNAVSGVPSAAQTFSVAGTGLSGDILITAPSLFQLSLDGTTFSNTLTLPQSSGTVTATTVYVRMTNHTTINSYTGSNAKIATLLEVGGVFGTTMRLEGVKSAAPPTITSFTPTSGALASTVTITGTNFTGATAVTINGTAATTFSVVSATSITATVPTGATTGTIAVTTAAGTATSTGTYTVIPAPTITSFTPASESIGSTITITGTNFTGATAVSFNGTAATNFTASSATQITATIPSGTTTGTIAVTTPGGTATSATSLTIVVPPPTITSFAPTSAEVGSSVTITGTGFSATIANNIVYFGSVKAIVTAASTTSLTVTVPKSSVYAPITVISSSLLVKSKDYFRVVNIPIGPNSITNEKFGSNIAISSTTGYNFGFKDMYIAAGDFDNDGKVDVVKGGNGSVKVHRNLITTPTTISSSSFDAGTNLTVTGRPSSVIIEDINSDGKLDIIAGSSAGVSVLINTSTGTGTISFANAINLAGSYADVLRAADFDLDGKLDLVTIRSASVAIYRNISTSSFALDVAQIVNIPTLTSCQGLGVGDFNKDSKTDIVVSNSSSTAILLNGSSVANITFPNNVILTGGGSSIAVADFDNDNDTDMYLTNRIIVNNYSSGSISSTNFTSFTYSNDGGSSAYSLSDFNGDGKLEVIGGTTWDACYLMIINTLPISSSSLSGIGYFLSKTYGYTAGEGLGVDVDGDNKVDYISAANYADIFSVTQNLMTPPPVISTTSSLTAFTTCTGTPSTAQMFTVSGSYLTANIAIAALNGYEYSSDGTTFTSTLSIAPVSGTVGATTVYVRLTGASSGTPSGNISISSTGATTQNLAVSGTVNPLPTITLGNFSNAYPNTASVNMPFTAVANAPTTYSVVAGTNALSGFTQITDASFSGSTGNLAVALPANPVPGTYDFNFTVKNANSCQSIVYSKSLTILPQPAIITSFAPKNIAISETLTITGEGFSTTTTENIVYIGGIKCSVTAATITSLTVTIPSGVSHSKILYTNTNSKNTAVSADYLSIKYSWPNNVLPNSTNFANTQTSIALDSPLFSGNSDRFSIADFENDGKPDVITYTGSPATLRYFKNSSTTTNGGFLASQMTASSLASIATSGKGGHALLLDIEGDGKLDVFGTVGGYDGSRFFQNTSTSTPAITTRTYPGSSYTGSPNVIDINKDGKTDIISGYSLSTASGFYTHLNTTAFGSSTFSFNYSTSPSSNATSMIRSFDMDGDSYEDVLSSQTNTIVVRRNMQNGTFSATPNNLTTSITPLDIRIADMNGDGISDIVYTGGNKIGVLINTSTSGNISTAAEFIIQTSNTSTVLGLTLADFNNDGKIDIIASGNSKLSVFLNTTTSSLSFDNELDLGSNMNNLSSIVALDLNGDTYMDIVGSNGSTIQYFVYQIVPVIALSSTNLTAFNTCQGTPSTSQSFNVSGTNLTSNITVAAFSGYEYSLDNTTFTSTISIPFGTGTITNVPVYVRLAGTFSGTPAGNITLTTTNGNSPTVAVTGTVPPAPYPYDRAVNFSNGGHLTKAAGASINLTNWTVEAWIYPTSWNYLAGIVSKRDFQFMTNSNGALSVMIERNWSWELTTTSNNVVILNKWQHVAASYNDSSKVVKIYVNGALVHTYTRGQFFTPDFNSFDLKIGYNNGQGNGSPSRTFAGNIDEVKVWNTVRTDAEVASNFATQLAGNETGLTAYYKFDQGVGSANNTAITSLTDATANANHLTPSSSSPVYAMNGSTNNILQVGPAILTSPNICLNATTTLTHSLSGGTWSSSDASIISIDSSTGAATANALGTATITYTFTDNSCTYTSTKLFSVLGLPTITAQPASTVQNICLNGTATALTVTATGAGLTYQWYKNSTASNTGGTSISGATSASYTPLTTTAGEAYYYCVVSGTCTPVVISDVSGLIKVYAPSVAGTITSSVTSICDSGTTLLTVSGSTGSVQWQRFDSLVWTDLFGETATTFTTPTLTQNTTYRAVITSGPCSSVNTANYIVTVYAAPTAPTATATINYCQGATATALTATAISGSNLQWYTVSSGGTASTTAPIPTTTTVGSTVYYVSQKANSGPFIIDNNSVSSYASNISNIGQTFLVPNNIKVNSITLKEAFINNVNASTVLKVYNGFGGALIATADSPYINSYSGWTTGILFSFTNQNITLTGGQTYYFEIISTSTMYPRYSNAYSDGTGYVSSAPTSNDFAFKLDATLNVNPCESPRTAITVNVNALPTISGVQNMTVGGSTLQLTSSGTPATTNPWVSSNTAVATISTTGEVTAVGGGNTTITYTNASGCSVNSPLRVVDCAQPFGNALSFGQSTDFVEVNSRIFPSQTVANFTIETWIKPSSSDIMAGTPGTNWLAFLGYSGSKRSPSLYITNNGVLHASWSEGASMIGTPVSASSPTALVLNKWTHIALVKDGTTMRLYANGVQIYVVTCAAILDLPDNAYWLGKSDQQFSGTLDEVRFWSSARNQADILSTMNTELVGNETGLLAYFNLNEGTAGGTNTGITTVVNKANNALNGTLTNFTKTGTSSNFVGSTISIFDIAGAATICGNSSSQFTHPIAGGTWSVSNGAAASISSSGLVTTIGAENITLTYVYTLNGCSFTVNKAIEVQLPTITGTQVMNVGGATISLTATTTAATTNPWVSSNAIVASVSNTGVVTALSEGTTTITFTNNAGCTATASITVNDCRTIFGNALNFDGTNDYVSVGDNIENLADVTTEAWVYWRGSSNAFSEIFTKDVVSALAITNTNKLHTNFGDGFGWDTGLNSTTSIPLNTWTHVAITRQSGVVKMFINGIEDTSTATLNFTGQNSNPRVIGGKLAGSTIVNGSLFNGVIDEIRFWSVAKTQTEINATRYNELAGNETSLVAYYNFNQGIASGNNASITSLNAVAGGFNGTFNNMPLTTGATSNFILNDTTIAILGSATVCNGSTTQFSHPVSGGTWSVVSGSSVSIDATGTITSVTSGNSTINYNYTLNGCSFSVTKQITVIELPAITAQPASTPQNICINGVTASISVTATGSGITYQWYKNTTAVNTGGTLITGATSSVYMPANNVAGSFYYYCVVSGTCTPAATSNVSGLINISPTSVAGTISGTSSICFGTTSTLTLSGNVGTIQWQRFDSPVWTSLTGETNATFTTPALTQNTTYRAVVISGTCTSVTTASFNITINALAAITTQPSTTISSICQNGTATTLSVVATGSGLTYQWYSNNSASTTGATLITGATLASYTPVTTSASALYYYCVVTGTCSTVTSNFSGLITISTSPIAGSASASATTICSGITTSLSLSGYTGSIQWQSSPNNSTWTAISGATSNTYTTPVLTTTTYYRATITSGTCTAVNSNAITITVNSLPAITTQPSVTSQNYCQNGIALALSVIATGSGVTYQWYKNPTASTTGGTAISGAISSSYTPLTTVAETLYYYCVVSGTCTPAITSAISGAINVSPTSVGGTITGTSSICSGTTSTLTLSGNVGTIQWQRFDNPIWTALTGETNTNFTTPALTQNTTYRAVVISGSCPAVNTTSFTIIVNPNPIISGNTSVGIGDTITIAATTTAATTNPWISSSTAVATVNNTGVVSGFTSGTTTITFTNNNGCTDTESITVITGTTQTPILTLPATNTTGATTLNFNYTLPETPLAGSVTLIFTPIAGGTPIIWSMNNATSAVFSYVVGTNPTTIANVVSGTALGFTTYNVTIAYQDAFANPIATATNSNIQTLAPPAISFANANYNGVINVPISIPTVNTGGAMETYSILPNLPAGMTLDTATGLISGTPTATLVQTTFTITASNAAGTDSETITLFIDVDTDGDGIGNANDPDIDNDGTPNAQDTNPLDWCQGFTPSTASTTWTAADCDNDGIANGSDVDVDGNGTNDNGTDTDGDGTNDTNDTDIDGDGIPNGNDADPNGDGVTDNGPDVDGDGINDANDPDIDGDGIPNGSDSDPDGNGTINNGPDTDGDGINDANDSDIDGDGIPNGSDADANGDGIPDTGVVDTDGDGITDAADSDPNGDGIIENGPDTDGDGINDANDTDIDGDDIPNAADVDPDGDGINNNGTDNDHDGINDANDPDIDGDGIPNNADVDVNGDGINDNGTDTDNDGINNTNDSDIDGDGVPNTADADPDGDGTMNNGPDTDGDGINDTADSDVNGDGIDDNGTDTDNDGINDANDTDIDGDGIPNGSDADPDGNGTINNGPDMDGDGINDAHDTDMDGDGIPNGADSDPDGNGTINNGLDTDDDGINDANDPDIDGDGIPNGTDGDANGDGITDTGVVDTDGDGITDAADSDPNGDGIIDNGPDTDGDGINDANDPDLDGDGIPNSSDVDPDGDGVNNNGTDTDNDGINDANDPDIDGDGIPNAADADINGDGIDDNGTDTDNDGINNSNDADIDGDGIPNVADADPDGDGTINNGPDTDGDGINDTADSDVNGDGIDDNGTDTDNDGINDANDPDLDGDGIPNGDDADPDGNGTINNGPDMDGDGINDANDTDMDGDGIPNGVDNCPNVVNPSITVQPNNQVVDVCPNTTPPTLTIQAVGEQLTYQWYSNTANSNIGGTILVGATNASYVPSNTLVGPRYYYVVINGTCGSEKSNVSGAITIQDLTLPTVLTQNISVALNAAGTASITAAQINNGSTDNCSIASVVVSPTNFTCANIGANTVTLTVTDVNGNVNTGTATVTVTETTLPTVLTQNISVALNAAGTASITAAQINNGSTDNCSIATVVVSPTTFTCANIGANTVTLTVTDVNGNVSTGTATVTVTDTTLPTVLTLNISVALNAVGTASITAAQINNGSTDNCSIATVVVSPSTFTCANIGANTVTLTVTDANGNVNTGTATVTITETILPIVLTQNFTAALNATGSASITAAQINNGSTDNCSIATVVVSPSTFTCANIGANTVTLTVTDVNGNVNTGTATVTVVDATLPTVVTQNISIILDAVGQGSITAAQINNGSTDNCGIATVTVSQLNFSCTNIGTNTVTLTVTDVNGNSNTGTAIVTVINNFVDTDGDGIKDNCDDDDDNDGESDVEENQNGTDPLNPCSFKNIPSITSPAWSHWSMLDCDNDGLTNGEEIGPDPNNPFDPNNNTIPDYIDPNNHATSDDGLEIFNLVTPNGDGENDVFVIRNIGLYPENSVEVYNRWGSKVYSIDGYGQNQNYFRGVSEGKVTVGQDAELPVGTYWYVLNYKNTQGVWIQRVGYLYLNK